MGWITNIAPLKEFILASRRRRTDFLICSDSNTVFGGYGQDHGITRALGQRFPLYKTGLLSANENYGGGASIGYLFQHANNGGRTQTHPITIVPSYNDYIPDGQQGFGTAHCYWHMTDIQSDASNTGMTVYTGGPWDVNAALRYSFTYGTFLTASGAGAFRPQIRRGDSPFTSLALAGATIDPCAPNAIGLVDYDIDLAAATRNYQIDGRFSPSPTPVGGPVFFTWQWFSWPGITTGTSFNVIGYYGGQGLRNMVNYQGVTPAAGWTEYFRQIARAQGTSSPKVCIMISSGLNDRTDANPSVGPSPQPTSSSNAGYADNLRGLIELYQDAWGGAGYPSTDIYFLLMCSHPVSSPDDSQLIGYREQCALMTTEYSNVTAIDMSQYNAQLQANRTTWYNLSGSDTFHMTQTGYEQFYQLIINGIMDEVDGGGGFRSRGGSRNRLLFGVR